MNAHANKIVSSWNQQYLNATMMLLLFNYLYILFKSIIMWLCSRALSV